MEVEAIASSWRVPSSIAAGVDILDLDGTGIGTRLGGAGSGSTGGGTGYYSSW